MAVVPVGGPDGTEGAFVVGADGDVPREEGPVGLDGVGRLVGGEDIFGGWFYARENTYMRCVCERKTCICECMRVQFVELMNYCSKAIVTKESG